MPDSRKILEAADSLAKASTPEPFSKSKTSNWVARGGGLPDYIQHIAHDLVEKRGKSESEAIQMAIGIVKNWASGQGNVDATTRAAARKALAEWEALKAKNKAKSVKEALMAGGAMSMRVSMGDMSVLEAAPTKVMPSKKVPCPTCKKDVVPTTKGKCPDDGTNLTKAMQAAEKG